MKPVTLRPRILVLAPLLGALVIIATVPAGAKVLAQWVQFRDDGAREARLVTDDASCPAYVASGGAIPTALRAAPNGNFPARICSAALPKATAEPNRIVVIGDTGCRIKGLMAQACDNPDAWPFAQVAAAAAKMKPDLVIHVGDYLYRESPCPPLTKECAGSPHGDNWASWNADLFTPAAPLLAAAAWLFVRGNHEVCERAGTGWNRLIGPDSFAPDHPCPVHLPPYGVQLGTLTLVAFDDGIAPDLPGDATQRPLFTQDFAAAAKLAHGATWYLMHRPIRGVLRLPLGIVAGGNQTLIPVATPDTLPANVELLLSGHIHTFEAIDYDRGPPQIIAGNGGDKLDAAPAELAGIEVGGLHITSGVSLPGFGFLLMTREEESWRADAYDKNGKLLLPCRLEARKLSCQRG